MKRINDPTCTSPNLSTESLRDEPRLTTLNLTEADREVCQRMDCFRADYVRVADTRASAEWSLRDHVANARMRLERLADVLALDVPVTGLEVAAAKALYLRAHILVRICEQRLAARQTAPESRNDAPSCCEAPL